MHSYIKIKENDTKQQKKTRGNSNNCSPIFLKDTNTNPNTFTKLFIAIDK